MKMYVMEHINDIGLVLKEVEVFGKPNAEFGKVIDGKCYGYTIEQCVEAFLNFSTTKLNEINEYRKEESEEYQKFQYQLGEFMYQLRENK